MNPPKIPLQVKPWKGRQPPNHHQTSITSSLPFIESRPGHVHRPRRGTIYWRNGIYSHTAVSLWCGNTSFPGSQRYKRQARFVPTVEPGHTVCIHCELKAVHAGEPSSETLVGHPVTFGLSRPPRPRKK